jgi:hypothetical protein
MVDFLRRNDAGEYLRKHHGRGSGRTLAKLASVGGGPEYQRAGRLVIYSVPKLDEWALAQLGPPQRSTAENIEGKSLPHGKRRGRPRRVTSDASEPATSNP